MSDDEFLEFCAQINFHKWSVTSLQDRFMGDYWFMNERAVYMPYGGQREGSD